MSPKKALDEAVSAAGSMQSLAELLGVTKGAVSQWNLDGRKIPVRHCPAIERFTSGSVRCEDLRPDFDWAFIRASAAPSVAAASQVTPP